MQKQNHSFVYYFAWLVIGLFLGMTILLFRGDISVDVNQINGSKNTSSAEIKPSQYQHAGYADAVMKAAPAVVSIQTINWSEPRDAT